MIIWVDADACPRSIKEVLYRTAARREIATVLVANKPLRVPSSPWIRTELVADGFDVADAFIADKVQNGDLVVTADIPLAAIIVDRGAVGIDPRGELYHEENVKHKLASRNLMASLREEGLMGGGPPPFTAKDKHRFAAALNHQIQIWAKANR